MLLRGPRDSVAVVLTIAILLAMDRGTARVSVSVGRGRGFEGFHLIAIAADLVRDGTRSMLVKFVLDRLTARGVCSLHLSMKAVEVVLEQRGFELDFDVAACCGAAVIGKTVLFG
ncbi:MAG TPA: hypothetical protein DD670_13505 [Planctomycetaceae bacterium]|nr:hypothetical protein [Planctomycetaceae bacterium]